MYVEEDLLIVNEVGVSSQLAGRKQTSARPVFSDPERVYCKVADPSQESLRRGEGSGGYSYANAVKDRVVRNSNAARRKSTKIEEFYCRFLPGDIRIPDHAVPNCVRKQISTRAVTSTESFLTGIRYSTIDPFRANYQRSKRHYN
ncbi:hypothetical protein HELRODRAFT_174300 [Helobdella robusta]|uniref:Uncharacterized protein n=1 Tax=Helobdella robusta TaxID=6412 RepID=T1F7Y8_HELRO|nr:hypothetical protein HELRODRAFT_174300 [Helobdella robusta]ESO02863.1 hypothetical protein HELRODRAFT_174300 [Helobdella robusta]